MRRHFLLSSLAVVAIASGAQVACNGEIDPVTGEDNLAGGYGYGYTPPAASDVDTCTPAGGRCLGHNAPSAKGQGPSSCAQFGQWTTGAPFKDSSLSCPQVSAGGDQCCMP